MKAIRTLSTAAAILTLTALAAPYAEASSKQGTKAKTGGNHSKPGHQAKKITGHPHTKPGGQTTNHYHKNTSVKHTTVKNTLLSKNYSKKVVINRRSIFQQNVIGNRTVIRPVSSGPDADSDTSSDPEAAPVAEAAAPAAEAVAPTPSPVRVAAPTTLRRTGLTAEQLEADFSRLSAAGYRLLVIRGYEVGGEERFDAVWRNDGCPAFVARAGQTPQEFEETAEALAGEGYALAHVSQYRVGGEDRRAAIWVLR